MQADSPDSGDLVTQALRVPGGWYVQINKLNTASRAENGDFGGSSLFYAVNEMRRFVIDVEFVPEFDPQGSFCLTVLYQPWPRTERGRRRTGEPFRLGVDQEEVHGFETASYPQLVEALEHWIARCSSWTREFS